MADEYPELDVPHPKKGDLHPGKMRRFMTHLSVAAIKAEDRSAKKQKIKSKLETIRSVSLNKRSTKHEIEHELGSFESVVKEIIHDEEKILEQQRRETLQINELKGMVEQLSSKIIMIGEQYTKEMREKDAKILELREALAGAHIKISESGEERQKKIELIEQRLKQKQNEPEPLPPRPPILDPSKPKHEHIAELETHLITLEQKHKELRDMGKHSKSDLQRVQDIIDSHKQKLSELKGEPILAMVNPPQVKPSPKIKKKAKPKAKRTAPAKKVTKKKTKKAPNKKVKKK